MKRRNKLHRLLVLLAAAAVLLATSRVALAHPLGNFTISRYSELTADDGSVMLMYIIDMAEIPAFQEMPLIDSDGDGEISSHEAETYRENQAVALLGNLELTVNGRPVPWTLSSSTLSFPPGQGDLDTLRLELLATAELPTGSEIDIDYADRNFTDRLGWREIVLRADEGQLLNSTAPSVGISNRLQSYPDDLLQSPPNVYEASASYVPTGGVVQHDTATSAPQEAAASIAGRFSTDEFGNLLSRAMDTPAAIAAVLALAFTLGAAHALTPGHGKTIVGAYLVGSRGTAKHAAMLGLTTTVTHTAGVFALGLLVLGASRFILPEKLFPWLGVASGLMVAAIGFSILRGHISHWRAHRAGNAGAGYHFHFGFGHSHVDTDHTHESAHDHSHERDHDHDHEHGHHHHDHDHESAHNHDHDHDHVHDHESAHDHADDHIPAILTSGEPISMRSLIALGVSGGMIPCPSALVLLLSAIALGQVGTGLVLILAFSAGLAGVLTAIGITMVYAGRALDRLPLRHSILTQRLLPIASATFITVAGSVIAIRALLEMPFV